MDDDKRPLVAAEAEGDEPHAPTQTPQVGRSLSLAESCSFCFVRVSLFVVIGRVLLPSRVVSIPLPLHVMFFFSLVLLLCNLCHPPLFLFLFSRGYSLIFLSFPVSCCSSFRPGSQCAFLFSLQFCERFSSVGSKLRNTHQRRSTSCPLLKCSPLSVCILSIRINWTNTRSCVPASCGPYYNLVSETASWCRCCVFTTLLSSQFISPLTTAPIYIIPCFSLASCRSALLEQSVGHRLSSLLCCSLPIKTQLSFSLSLSLSVDMCC